MGWQEELEVQKRLAENLKDHSGQYVIVKGDQVVETADSWGDVFAKAEAREDMDQIRCLFVSPYPMLLHHAC